MCGMMKPFGMMVLIPSTMLLVVSFFVILAIRKLEAGMLKTFGKVIVALLFICAAMVIIKGINHMPGDYYLKGKMMQGRMKCPPMMQGQGMQDDQMMVH